MQSVRSATRRITIGLILALLLILGVRPLVFRANAANILSRSIEISSDQPASNANYKFSFQYFTTTQPVGSVSFEFCANSPLIGDVCNPPAGLDANSVSLINQQGETGFSIDVADSTVNKIVITRPAANPAAVMSSYEFANMTNPNAFGSYFARVETFSSTDGTGSPIDAGGLAYVIQGKQLTLTTKVPPFLLFCTGLTISNFDCNTATGDYINFGELSTSQTRFGSSQMVLATNAGSGYNLFLDGSTMTSGNNTIQALTANDVSRPGTAQFGVNLRRNTDPSVGENPSGPGSGSVQANYNTPNRFRFVAGEELASTTTSSDYRKFTVSYIVNVPHGQTPGIYVTSVTFDCLANF